MANSNLSRFETEDGIELVINQQSGCVYTSVRGLARMCDRNESTIRSWQGARNIPLIEAEILTQGGLQGARLFNEDGILDALEKYNPVMLRKFANLGVRFYYHSLIGFKQPTEQTEEPKALPTSYEKAQCVNSLAASLQMFEIEIHNPRFKQSAKDLVCDILGFNQNEKLLTEQKEIWLGVAERAEQLGYNASLVSRFRSTLGKFVKANGLACKREKRLCNGTEREINLYLLTDALDNAIKEYMDAKVLAN